MEKVFKIEPVKEIEVMNPDDFEPPELKIILTDDDQPGVEVVQQGEHKARGEGW